MGNKNYEGLLRSDSGMIFPKVQRMDTNFMRTSITKQRWWERLIMGRLLTEGMLLLDENGDKITEVCEIGGWTYLPYAHGGGWHRTETVYEALRRIGTENIIRVKYAFYYFNRGRVSNVMIYKTPKDCTLLELFVQYDKESLK